MMLAVFNLKKPGIKTVWDKKDGEMKKQIKGKVSLQGVVERLEGRHEKSKAEKEDMTKTKRGV